METLFKKYILRKLFRKTDIFQQDLDQKRTPLIVFEKLGVWATVPFSSLPPSAPVSTMTFYNEKQCQFLLQFMSIWKIMDRANNYIFKVSNRNTRKSMCKKLTIHTAERRQWRRLSDFIVTLKKCFDGQGQHHLSIIKDRAFLQQ